MTTLYHFACDHSRRGIQSMGGLIVPRWQPGLGRSLVWMTHDPAATRDMLGLSSHSLGCDRMQHRFIIASPEGAQPWNQVRHTFPRGFARMLEATPGTRPTTWWVSLSPQHSTTDASYPQA